MESTETPRQHGPRTGPDRRRIEMWAGVECTVNRVHDQYFDQLEASGHADRIADLDQFAALGITRIRYPVLFERVAPEGLAQTDWSWPDARLARLRERNIAPIMGLVHHGSGPRATSLLDPAFPARLAEFAAAVARRYPWVDAYTPVNEPLTTARFSGLYGHWYPHARDDASFSRILINECKAVTLSMQAIRDINPDAMLVQTDDLGKVFCSPSLEAQAAFENERRWVAFDLIAGRLTPEQPMWQYFLRHGIPEIELHWFNANPCRIDILGLNYYLTSLRFLDARTRQYPPGAIGGNGLQQYADVEAIRVAEDVSVDPTPLLVEAWERYNIPLAITEVHNGCTREEQLRWFVYIWDAVSLLNQRRQVKIQALTAWALLGSHDWNSLVTRRAGHYEPGVFDIRAPAPRPTMLADAIAQLATGRHYDHPVLHSPGWWERPSRFELGFSVSPGNDRVRPSAQEHTNAAATYTGDRRKLVSRINAMPQPILIVGATGTLGRAFGRICEGRGLAHQLLRRAQLDIADAQSIKAAIETYQPWAIINAAGYVRVDDAESDAGRCFRENHEGAALLAHACARHKLQLLTFSSDLVFDGSKQAPYVESDPVRPLNVYGESKARAEADILAADGQALIVRTSSFFGPWDEYNFVTLALRALTAGQRFDAVDDCVMATTYVPDLVHASLDLLLDGAQGIWHLANAGETTWYGLAQRAARAAGISTASLNPISVADAPFCARRPAYSVLTSERAWLMPSLDDAMARYLRDCEVATEAMS